MRSIIILCGGRSKRMGKDKGLLLLNEKPMILHLIDMAKVYADEILIVLRDYKQAENYKNILKKENINFRIITDESKDQGPLIGIFTGLSNIKSRYALILPCDSPFISKRFVLNMFNILEESELDAVVPIWDDGHTEPLHSIYNKNTLNIIKKIIDSGKRDVNSLIKSLNVKFIDVKELDPTLASFQNMNTINDLNNYTKRS